MSQSFRERDWKLVEMAESAGRSASCFHELIVFENNSGDQATNTISFIYSTTQSECFMLWHSLWVESAFDSTGQRHLIGPPGVHRSFIELRPVGDLPEAVKLFQSIISCLWL